MTSQNGQYARVAADRRPPAPAGPSGESHRRGQRLATEAAEAAELRAHATDPDVIALRIERVRTQVDRMCWAGILLGLAFTMTNVQHFASAGTAAWSLPWLAAWLLDPMVSLVLLAILRAEQVTARYQVHTGPWVRAAKWLTLGATYLMNAWTAWAAGSVAGIVLHSVPPLMVFAAAEAVTDLRDKLTFAVSAAVTEALGSTTDATKAATRSQPTEDEPVRPAPRAGRQSGHRKWFADYLTEARMAWTPDVVVTPAWVRQVTGCSRGLSSRVATALTDELDDDTNGDGQVPS